MASFLFLARRTRRVPTLRMFGKMLQARNDDKQRAALLMRRMSIPAEMHKI